MSLKKINPTQTSAWKALTSHFNKIKNIEMKEMFSSQNRVKDLTINWDDFTVDFSKNRLNDETLELLLDLASQCHLKDSIDKQYIGEKINQTEKRSVLHTAVRTDGNEKIIIENKNIVPSILESRQKIKNFTNDILSGKITGVTNKEFTDVVNIGIGGSDLGPDMVVEGLKYYSSKLKPHFISNVDGDHVLEILKELNPETTLFIVVSKTFTTAETMLNARTARAFILAHYQGNEEAVGFHMSAVSTNLESTGKLGISPESVFGFWDWVGGRFSVSSAVGLLPLCLFYGWDVVSQFLTGMHEVDLKFKECEARDPCLMLGLIGFYNTYICGHACRAVLPYCQALLRFPAHIQQLDMESNGKSVALNGTRLS